MRADEALEPFCFRSRTAKLCEELLHSQALDCIVDLLAADGNMAKACILHGKPYVGVCSNQIHLDKLMERLTEMIVKEINDPQSKLRNFAPKKRNQEQYPGSDLPGQPEKKPRKKKSGKKPAPKSESESGSDDPVTSQCDSESGKDD